MVSLKGHAMTGELEQFQSSGDSEPRADQTPVETGQNNVSVSGSGKSGAMLLPGNTVQSSDQLNMSQLTGDAELSITGQTISQQRQAQATGPSCPRWWGEVHSAPAWSHEVKSFMFCCWHCRELFGTTRSLSTHSRHCTHGTEGGTHECLQCGVWYNRPVSLQFHNQLCEDSGQQQLNCMY